MPSLPLKSCSVAGCSETTKNTLCEYHLSKRRKEADSRRGSSHSRGYGRKWQEYRLRYLAKHPLCVRCLEAGITMKGIVIDHIVPHRGNKKLFWDQSNHQTLCVYHHNVKTGKGE